MMKDAPVASLVMPKTEFLFEFKVVALDAPAHLDGGHQILKRDGFGQVGQEIMRGLGFTARPFDEQPFFIAGTTALRGTHTHPREARSERRVGAFTPFDRAKARRRQRAGEIKHAERLMARVASHADASPTARLFDEP